ncbi:MAG: AsmA family protein [Rubrivivax sp.]|nr:AsmA family protein [Rubrivivax sp.]
MVWMRRVGWAAGAVMTLLLVAVAAGWWLFDAARVQQTAVQWVQDRYQRTLVIAQPIELSMLPRPRLKLAGVSLSEHGRPERFAAIGSAEVTPRLLPLLRGQIVVEAIELQGVQATLIRRRDGTRNTDDLTGVTAAPSPPSASAPAGGDGGGSIEIGRLRLRDLQLTLRDDTGGPAGQLKLALLEAGRLRSAAGAFSVAPLSVQVAQLQTGGLALSSAQLDVTELAVGGTPRRITLQDLKLTAVGRQGGLGFEGRLAWPRLALQGDTVEGSPLEGEFKTSGSSTLAGRLQTGAPTGDLATLRLPGLVLGAKGRVGAREIDATLKAALALQPQKGALQLEGLALQARLLEPGLQPLALALQGRAGGSADTLRWALKGALNDNQLDAEGELRLAGKVPALRATARFDRLDLNRVLAPAAAAASAPAGGAPADTPINLEGLRAVNGTVALSAGALSFRQYRINDARLDAQLDGGVLRVNRLSGRAWGGQIDGRGSADAQGSRVALALTASDVDIQALLRDVAGKDLLEGRGRVSATLQGQGQTLGALRSSLAGQAALQLRDGAVKGVNLAKSFRQAKAALSMKQDAVTRAQVAEKTDFSELTATARMADGVATSDDLDLKSPFLRVGGAGRFDIGRGLVDYTARATVVAVPAGQDTAGLAAMKGVTVPVRLSGPFDAIAWKIQWSDVASAALKDKVQDKAKEKLNQKLGDKLKGLLGR